jgi:hypothetical protein
MKTSSQFSVVSSQLEEHPIAALLVELDLGAQTTAANLGEQETEN